MSDSAIARVVWQLERVAHQLAELESATRGQTSVAGAPTGPLSVAERDDLRQADQFALGVIEGLVQAQLVVSVARTDYVQRHRPATHRRALAADTNGP